MTLTEIKAWYYHPKTVIPKTLQVQSGYYKDVRKSIQTYIRYLEAHPGNATYKPYYDNLMEIHEKLNKCTNTTN